MGRWPLLVQCELLVSAQFICPFSGSHSNEVTGKVYACWDMTLSSLPMKSEQKLDPNFLWLHSRVLKNIFSRSVWLWVGLKCIILYVVLCGGGVSCVAFCGYGVLGLWMMASRSPVALFAGSVARPARVSSMWGAHNVMRTGGQKRTTDASSPSGPLAGTADTPLIIQGPKECRLHNPF